jgi:aspartate racemase
MKHKKTIGILGGMGPEATAYLFSSIIRQTKASTDQDHIHVLIDNNPQIPDRSAYILGEGPDPIPAMVKSAKRLQKAGADFIIIPCNTAHYFLNEISTALTIPILDMIETTADYIRHTHPQVGRTGLLATLGTYKTNLYEKVFSSRGIEILVPDQQNQQVVMEAIYGKEGIKAGYRESPAGILVRQSERLVNQGADAILCGCTEISLVLRQDLIPIRIFNSLDILAYAAVREAGYETR